MLWPPIEKSMRFNLISVIGEAVTIPVYDTTNSNGNNAWFRVVGFAAVRIVKVDFTGNPKYLVVQPALVHDETLDELVWLRHVLRQQPS